MRYVGEEVEIGVRLPTVLKEYLLCMLQVEEEASVVAEVFVELLELLYVTGQSFDGNPSVVRGRVRGLVVPRCYRFRGIPST